MASPNTSPTGGIGWRNLRTGILFVLGLTLVAMLGLIIGKNTGVLTRHETIHIFVADIKGLTEGNLVSISGKKVGTVDKMVFVKRGDTTGVLVDLRVQSDYFKLVTTDAVAIIKSLGVLGDKFVDIALGSSDELIQDGGYLVAGHDPGIEDLTASALKTMNAIEQVSAKINRGEGTIGQLVSSSDISDRIASMASRLELISIRLSSNEGIAGRLINDKELGQKVTTLVNSLSDLSVSLKEGKGSLGKFMTDETFYTNLSGMTQRADSLLLRLNDPDGSFAKLANNPQLYDQLTNSLRSMDSLLIDLKENPGRYVKLSLF